MIVVASEEKVWPPPPPPLRAGRTARLERDGRRQAAAATSGGGNERRRRQRAAAATSGGGNERRRRRGQVICEAREARCSREKLFAYCFLRSSSLPSPSTAGRQAERTSNKHRADGFWRTMSDVSRVFSGLSRQNAAFNCQSRRLLIFFAFEWRLMTIRTTMTIDNCDRRTSDRHFFLSLFRVFMSYALPPPAADRMNACERFFGAVASMQLCVGGDDRLRRPRCGEDCGDGGRRYS